MKLSELKKLVRSVIKEAEEEQPAANQPASTDNKGGGLVDINASPDQVLAAAAKIPQNILQAGKTDGNPTDEKITISPGTATANSLEPTQSEIGSAQSLDDQIMDKYGNLDNTLNGNRVSSAGGKFPILTFGGKYILDGHHRWSQFMATNPTATVDIADIKAPNVDTPKEAINLAHVILFALYGKSPTKPFKGENLIGMGADKIKDYVRKNIVDSALQKLTQAKKIAKSDKELAAEFYAKNLAGLKGGQYPRTVMPQPADAGDADQLTKTPPLAASGDVNYLNPKQSDVKENQIQEVKRLQKLAGIIKG